DLAEPLARAFAGSQDLPRPFRRYQVGQVWRFEKPGPGRFREFYQFDFDTVGSASMAADAESCALACDALEALGFRRGEYIIRVNNRKALQGTLESAGLGESDISDDSSQVSIALRAIDKLDRIGIDGVNQLLDAGRKDESGDFTAGAGLDKAQIDMLGKYLQAKDSNRSDVCDKLEALAGKSKTGAEGVAELREIDRHLAALGYQADRVEFDPTIVRGLGYYTGPVFEGVITKQLTDKKGVTRDFGSVFGGGRYDTLVQRFTGQAVPATGASIGIDRLLEAAKLLQTSKARNSTSDVLVTVMDTERIDDYLKLTQQIRSAGINAEMYLGSRNLGKQLQYADRCEIPLAIIAGSEEFESGQYQIKDLELGRQLAAEISDHEQWRKGRPSQQPVMAGELIAKLKELLKR
ncbi:MAG: histidine--tRNA ligase, partial [candidate division Zixibacteria bacterium]|nr:histidine--tRNA ligase [candidate division Zixibacteria bacterium]